MKVNFLLFFFFYFLMSNFSVYSGEGGSYTDISEIITSVEVSPDKSALVIVCLEDGSTWTSGGSRIASLYPPASTSKILHTLIALEEGYAQGPHAYFKWDGKKRFLEVWNQDQTLLSAYKNSALWVYQQITQNLGHQTMSFWIDRLEYGNRFIGTSKDIMTYWLDGPLLTSVLHQVEFLSRLANELLPLSPQTFRAGKSIMQESSGDHWVLYGKSGFTGTVGWYVGWVEAKVEGYDHRYVFAFNMDVGSWDELPKRKEVIWAALKHLGVLPKEIDLESNP